MSNEASPLIRLEADGSRAPVLSYNVPEPTSYSGNSYIEVPLDEEVFQKRTRDVLARENRIPVDALLDIQASEVAGRIAAGEFEQLFPNARSTVAPLLGFMPLVAQAVTAAAQATPKPDGHGGNGTSVPSIYNAGALMSTMFAVSSGKSHDQSSSELGLIGSSLLVDSLLTNAARTPDRETDAAIAPAASEAAPLARLGTAMAATAPSLATLTPELLAANLRQGRRLNIYQTMYGTYSYTFIPEPVVRPRIVIVESYRLSTFLGDYGAGRTIKTFTLLPGENTKISIKTYKKTETDAKKASSVLDSFTEESAADFETSVQSEQTDKRSTGENFEYHAEAEAQANWGWGSAKISGGIKGGSNAAREELAKNLSNATQKHAQKASAKREVNINTSTEVRESSGEETAIEREIENINVGRTLNFVFRQMNQEFITLLHLVDIRIAFHNGYAEQKREVPLSKLDSLLEEVIAPAQLEEVRETVLDQIRFILDWRDEPQELIEPPALTDGPRRREYWRVKRHKTDIYTSPVGATGAPPLRLEVPGVITQVTRSVLRTDGVIVEALLGQGNGLDTYSSRLQEEAVAAKQATTELQRLEARKLAAAIRIVEDKDEVAARIFAQVFPPPPAPAEED